MTTTTGTEETLKNYQGPEGVVRRWLKENALVEQNRRQKAFETLGQRIMKKYRNAVDIDEFADSTAGVSKRVSFNVLWSNTQVLKPALYSRMPKVVGERVFKDSDPVGRLAAEIAERATHFQLMSQQDRFNYAIDAAVEDRLLCGRGQVWLEYKTDWEELKDENGEPVVDADGNAIKRPKPNTERVEVQHVNFMDYMESLARNQYEVRWRRKRIYMTRAQMVSEFGEEIGNAVAMQTDSQSKRKQEDDADFLQQAEIFVFYDLDSKQVLWITEGYKEAPLKQLDDPYKLKDFWCCPIPLCATTTTDSTYPTPDYVIYEGLADELNYITKRLKAMVECVKLVGAVAEAFSKDVKKITRLADGEAWPMPNWGGFAEKGGFKGIIDWMPFDQCVAAIPVLQQRWIDLKGQIDEITSMPDIVRGSSDPNDPVYTQQQKSHWTVIKLTKKQQDVQRFCREIVSKMAELIFEPGLFSDETIYLMAGVAQMTPEQQELFPYALQLLRDDRLRTFRIDIETDSTIAMDEEQQMGRWMQYLTAIKDIVGTVADISQYRPELMEPVVQSALSAVRTLRTGRSVEGAWEKAFDEIQANNKAAAEAAANTPPPPDPELIKAEAVQVKTQIEQSEAQFNQWEKQQRLSLDSMKMEGDFQLKQQANEIAAGEMMSRERMDKLAADIDLFQKQFTQALEAERLEFERQSKTAEIREKLMEEARLDRQDRIETVRVMNERIEALAASGEAKGGGKGGSSQPVNVNTGPVTMMEKPKDDDHEEEIIAAKDPVTGIWRGRKRKIPKAAEAGA